MYSIRHRRLNLPEKAFEKFDIWHYDESWKYNKQDGSMPDNSLLATLYKDESDGAWNEWERQEL